MLCTDDIKLKIESAFLEEAREQQSVDHYCDVYSATLVIN